MVLLCNYSNCICYAGEVAGVLCGVGGEGVCGELLPYITGGIQGNLERDSGELDPQLSQKLGHANTPSSSSLENSQMERRVERVGCGHAYVDFCMCVCLSKCVCVCVCVCVAV